MTDVSVAVRKSGRVIEQVVRPLRQTSQGPAVTYRRQLWPLSGNFIDLDNGPLVDERIEVAEVSVIVRKGGRVIERVERPLSQTSYGPAVTYRKRLWLLAEGGIDLDKPPIPKNAKDSTPNLDTILSDPDEPPNSEILGSDAESNVGETDLAQEAVIALPCDARVLVDAGPGTGKTHVACKRIAALIRNGAEPNRIWVVSFTRTAVTEFRNRIASALGDPIDAASVRIATLDSHAWSLQSGFSANAVLSGCYEDNIVATLKRIREDPDAVDYLSRLHHIIIDEGQDILGVRAELSLALIDGASTECGVTVFADEAQAIYNFADDAISIEGTEETLADALRERSFQQLSLSRIHRTKCPKLRTIFTDVRRQVLDRRDPAADRRHNVRRDIVRFAHADAGPAGELKLREVPNNSLVLFRRRIDVLESSSWNADVPHRLRMSGLPARLLSWITALFWDFTNTRLSRIEFDNLWANRITGYFADGAIRPDAAWQLLFETAGVSPTVINVTRLRELLSRPSPPMLFCSAEFGDSGPILGTIHASKGREADDVLLFLPPIQDDDHDIDEETRVNFVGATRARLRLYVGESLGGATSALASNRVWKFSRKGKVRIEIGRVGDIDASGLVGLAAFSTSAAALKAQNAWISEPVRQRLLACKERDLGWQYALRGAQGERLAVFSPAFDGDVKELGRRIHKWRTPNSFPHIRSLGLRSVVMRPDDPAIDQLHEPWRTSGFLFAPLITAFSSGKFEA